MSFDDDLLSPEDAAKVLKVSRRTVDKFLREGSLSGSKIGRFWRIKPDDLDNFIENERGTGRVRGHASNHIREIFYKIIDDLYENDDYLKSKENRQHTRNLAGRMWACTDVLPSQVRGLLEDITGCYLNDYERGKKIGNCSQLARLLMDIVDRAEEKLTK